MTNHSKLSRGLTFALPPFPLFLGLGVVVAGSTYTAMSVRLFWESAVLLDHLLSPLIRVFVDFDRRRERTLVISWGPLTTPAPSFFLDPLADVDASASTDADDLVVFVADIFEFAEHEQALLFDSLTEVFVGAAFAGLGGASAALSVRTLKVN